MPVASKPTFIPVNRIGEDCACCGRARGPRAVRGVRVEVKGLRRCDVLLLRRVYPTARESCGSPLNGVRHYDEATERKVGAMGELKDGECRLVRVLPNGETLAVCREGGKDYVGIARNAPDGSPILPGEQLYVSNGDGTHRRIAIEGRPLAVSTGPAQVATEEYRSSWERTFGGNRATVGQA